MICVKNLSFNLMLNGTRISSFNTTRGIQQGDPISPFLFIILADTLSKMVSQASYEGLIKGIKITSGSPILTHLFFVNDALFFLEASQLNLIRLKWIINAYCVASRQIVNFQKSSLQFSACTLNLQGKYVVTVLALV